jgi:molecular chaperone HscB
MQWREALEEAAGAAEVERLEAEVAAAERKMLADVARLLDVAGDAPAAAAEVRALMFVNRFRQDIERRQDALDPAHTR